jgi:hypothetical protein
MRLVVLIGCRSTDYERILQMFACSWMPEPELLIAMEIDENGCSTNLSGE